VRLKVAPAELVESKERVRSALNRATRTAVRNDVLVLAVPEGFFQFMTLHEIFSANEIC